MNTKFYCEHNQTVCLTKFAVGQIENQLNGCKCKNCGIFTDMPQIKKLKLRVN